MKVERVRGNGAVVEAHSELENKVESETENEAEIKVGMGPGRVFSETLFSQMSPMLWM